MGRWTIALPYVLKAHLTELQDLNVQLSVTPPPTLPPPLRPTTTTTTTLDCPPAQLPGHCMRTAYLHCTCEKLQWLRDPAAYCRLCVRESGVPAVGSC